MATESAWYDEEIEEIKERLPTNGNRILQFVCEQPMTYTAEITQALELSTRTVTKWLKRLVKQGLISQIDIQKTDPTAEQKERVADLMVHGMQKNHFHNAKWYVAIEGVN